MISEDSPFGRYLLGRGFSLMLLLLLAYMALNAYGQVQGLEGLPLLNLVLGAALVAGVYAAGVEPRWRHRAVAALVVALVLQVSTRSAASPWVANSHQLLGLAVLCFVLAATLVHVFHAHRVTPDTIFGTICVYFLLAAFWSILYGVCYRVIGPDAFEFAREVSGDGTPELFYYSWVTLTTLGYGDITPAHPFTRVLANIECFVGQFYIAIVVARLVAIQITQASRT